MAFTRRALLKTIGSGVAGATVAVNLPAERTKNGWKLVDAPVEGTLYSVVMTRLGPVAVGDEGKVLLRRPDKWDTLLPHGPEVGSNGLLDADVTEDGWTVWFTGGSGAVAQYDLRKRRLTDYSEPGGKTSTWDAISVVGRSGDERVYLLNGSGEFVAGEKRADGGMDWDVLTDVDPTEAGVDVVKPGGGSSALGLDFYDSTSGMVTDTTSKVYETRNAGAEWETIGIEDASVGLYDIAAISARRALVAGTDGHIYRYDGANWTPKRIGQADIYNVTVRAHRTLATGASGYVYERTDEGWESAQTPAEGTLHSVTFDTVGDFPDVAVGDSASIVEAGEYEGSLPNSLHVSGDTDAATSYRFVVSDLVAKGDDATDAQVSDNRVVEAVVRGDGDSYAFAGEITEFIVTGGNAEHLRVTVNGSERDIGNIGSPPWRAAVVPTEETLHDVAQGASGPVAVGEDGRVLERRSGADGDDASSDRDRDWREVTEHGVAGQSYGLRAAAATEDGGAVWIAGESGTLGRYDPAEQNIDDYTAPDGFAGTWTDLSVVGATGEEHVFLVDEAGRVVRGRHAGTEMAWDGRPVDSITATAISFLDAETGYLVDANADVFETTNGGEEWHSVGIEHGGATLTDVAIVDPDAVYATTANGTVYRYNGAVWTQVFAGGSPLRAITERTTRGLVVGAGGSIRERGEWGWEPDDAPTDAALYGVAAGTATAPTVIVGESGTVLER